VQAVDFAPSAVADDYTKRMRAFLEEKILPAEADYAHFRAERRGTPSEWGLPPVVEDLKARGRKVELLDGDEVREHLSKGLGFSKADRDTNIRRIGWVASVLARNGVVSVTAAISPYRALRDEVRGWVENFVEVHVATPLEECARRDPKGLYAAAFAGEIDDFTGVSAPYEAPSNPEITLDTTGVSPSDSAAAVMERLAALNVVHA